jgi:hypothetical protein
LAIVIVDDRNAERRIKASREVGPVLAELEAEQRSKGRITILKRLRQALGHWAAE